MNLQSAAAAAVAVFVGLALALSGAARASEIAAPSSVLGDLKPADLAEPLSDAQRHRLAALIYERFVEVMALSGYEVQVTTSEFATIRSEQFPQVRASDTQSYDAPKRLNVMPITSSLNGVVQGVTYKPEWEATPDNPTAEEVASVTFLDSLAESKSMVENFEAPVAVTTFRVHVVFAGEELRHRAMFSWLIPDKKGMARFRADDVNIQFLNEAFAETRQIAPRSLFKARTKSYLIP